MWEGESGKEQGEVHVEKKTRRKTTTTVKTESWVTRWLLISHTPPLSGLSRLQQFTVLRLSHNWSGRRLKHLPFCTSGCSVDSTLSLIIKKTLIVSTMLCIHVTPEADSPLICTLLSDISCKCACSHGHLRLLSNCMCLGCRKMTDWIIMPSFPPMLKWPVIQNDCCLLWDSREQRP